MNRSLIFDLATAGFISRHEDALFLGPPGTGKSHLAQATGPTAGNASQSTYFRAAAIHLKIGHFLSKEWGDPQLTTGGN